MHFSTVAFLSGLLPLALSTPLATHRDVSAATTPRNDNVKEWDAIIVGGGPAGLSALSGLARVRRNVLLIDSAEYRNELTRRVHDVINLDGVTPAYLRWKARDQLSHYKTVTAINGTVTKIEPLSTATNNTSFKVYSTWGNDTVPQVHVGRKIVLATGIRDILPDTPGLQENWARGIYWCPWCDGEEHADQPLGLIANLTDIPGLVREVLTLNRDIVAFTNGTDTPDIRAATEAGFPSWETFLDIHNVKIADFPIKEIVRLKTAGTHDPDLPTEPEFDQFRVDFADGSPSIERNAFLVSFPDEQRSSVGEDLGVNLYGGRLAANSSVGLQTNIPGVYAIGDANSDNVTNVPHAMFSGKRTAVYLHVAIAREDAAQEIANQTAIVKRKVENMADLWTRMNPADDVTYAGEFDI
jgi:thioredoxin reductase